MHYKVNINWTRHTDAFHAKSFDRTHQITFGGGSTIEGSSAPEFLGKAELVNPEELFAASITSCLMLTFLYWAAVKGLVIDQYSAETVGTLAKNEEGKMAMTEIVIKPKVTFSGTNLPDAALIQELFNKAHENCFISNSVKTLITIQTENT